VVGLGRQFPAKADGHAGLPGRRHQVREHLPEHGLVRLVIPRHVHVVAVHRKEVLEQVVRADGGEVGLGQQAPGLQDGRGHLEHRPVLQAAGVEVGGRLVHNRPGRPELREARDHRVHHLDGSLPGRPRDRPGLRPQQIGVPKQVPHAAKAQRGVVLLGEGEERRGLVAPEVQQPQRHGPAVHRPDDAGVPLGLLVLGEEPAGREELHLRPVQADALGLVAIGDVGLFGDADVREHAEALDGVGPSGRAGRPARGHAGQGLLRRPDDDLSGAAVDHNLRAAGHQVVDVRHAADGRDAEPPRQDGRVRGGAPPFGYDAEHVVGIEFHGQRGAEFLGHDDPPFAALAVRLVLAREGRRGFGQFPEQAALQFAEVAGPLVLVRVAEFAHPGLVRLEGALDGNLGVAALVDGVHELRFQRGVLQNHALDGEDLGLGVTNPFADDVA